MKITLDNTYVHVTQAEPDEHDWLFSYLTFEAPQFRGGQRYGDGKMRLYNTFAQTFLAGFLPMVTKAATADGLTIDMSNPLVPPCAVDPNADLRWLRWYQREALEAVLKHGRGILHIPTAGGKTEVFCGLTRALPCRWLFLVHRKGLMHQAADRVELRAQQHGLQIQVGRYGDGTYDPHGQIVFATFQTLMARANLPATQRLLDGAEGVCVDECHTVAAHTFLRVMLKCRNATYRVGISGTPLARDDKRSHYAVGALGPVIYRIKPEVLIEEGVLAKPSIRMLPVEHKIDPTTAPKTWQGMYSKHVVRSAARNQAVVKAVQLADKPCLLFVKEINHGKSLLKRLHAAGLNAEFNYGTTSEEGRKASIERLVRGDLDVLIASSLPYNELLLVRANGTRIQLMPIGKLVEEGLRTGSWEVWTRLANGQDGWAHISAGIVHPRNGVPIVETRLRGGARALTTNNHALIKHNGKACRPRRGVYYMQAKSAPSGDGAQEAIDVCERLHGRPGYELLLAGLTQARIRMLKNELRHLRGHRFADPRTTARVAARLARYTQTHDTVAAALEALVHRVSWSKGKWRMAIPQAASDVEHIGILGITFRVHATHSGSRFSLPLRLPVTPALARMTGIFVAEGHTHSSATQKFAVVSAYESTKPDSREGFAEKTKIRSQFIADLQGTLGWQPRLTPKQIQLPGKAAFALFRHVLGVGGKAPTKRVPNFVWSGSAEIRNAFLWGYFLGDGHRSENMTSWSTVSRELAIGCYYLLLGLGKRPSMTRDTHIHTEHKSKHRRYVVATRDPIFGFVDTRTRPSAPRGLTARAQSVRPEPEAANDTYVYDICVPGVERFYAGAGVLAHNTIYEMGTDIPELRSVVIASGGRSIISTLQRIGRGMRVVPGKTTFEVFDFDDRGSRLLERHSRRRRKSYESEGYTVTLQGAVAQQRRRKV